MKAQARYPHLLIGAVVLALTLCPASALAGTADPFGARVREALLARFEEARPMPPRSAGGETIHSASTVSEFYTRRFFQPAWSWRSRPTAAAHELAVEIRAAAAEGLMPEHYHLQAIETLLAEADRAQAGTRQTVAMLADLDLLLTDAFLVLGSHYLSGRIDPAAIDPQWHAGRRTGDLLSELEAGLRTGEIGASLRRLLPAQPEYAGLRAALVHYRQIAAEGGWIQLAPGPALRRGDTGSRVLALGARLASSGDLSGPVGQRFDEELEEGVRRFQARHGLEIDGVVGRGTLAALNVPVTEQIRQIEVNLERWRWLPANFGERYLLVNIADYHLQAVENGEAVLQMRVVVGRPSRPTPVFTDRMTYLVLNPSWEVPEVIAVEDVLPIVRQDTSYLARMNIKVFQGWGANAREIDPAAVDWMTLAPKRFPFRFQQAPGPLNALGRVKFMFPNAFDVYLHDTPAKNLFRKETRTFSSGCVRLERPLELAEFLLQGSRYGSRAALDQLLSWQEALQIPLPAPIPVHLLYWTSWVDQAGNMHFRPDVYGRDGFLRLALDQPPFSATQSIAAPLALPGGAGG